MQRHFLLPLCLALLAAGCALPVKGLYPPPPGHPDNHTLYVVSHGWHTGVVFQKPQAAIPALGGDFKEAPYLEVGWGDEGFYQAETITSGLTVRAIFWPTDSVLHVVAVPLHPRQYFLHSEVVELEVSREGFAQLMAFIHDSFAVDEKGAGLSLGPGIYGTSRFYRARGTYYALNTCNVWTAQAIRATGFPITPAYALNAGNVLYQLETGLSQQ